MPVVRRNEDKPNGITYLEDLCWLQLGEEMALLVTYTVKGVGEQEQRGGASSWKGGRVTLGRGDKTVEEVEERSQEKLVANWRVSTRDAMAIKRSKGSHYKLLPPGTTEGGEAIGRVVVCRALAATAHDQTWWSRAILRRCQGSLPHKENGGRCEAGSGAASGKIESDLVERHRAMQSSGVGGSRPGLGHQRVRWVARDRERRGVIQICRRGEICCHLTTRRELALGKLL
ncbi:hypothetical protein BHM03_00021017 [Ensete ventricosum]|nr:hypothetical protein BHM03_00021017 [Ensete ventricosum]